MTRLGVGLFTLRRLDEPKPQILERAAELGYEGVEFVDRVDRDMDFDAVSETLAETGLEPLGAHVWLHQLEEELDTLVDRYDPLGVDTFVIPYHPETNFRNPRRMRWLAERINDVARRVRNRGFELHYHPNHWDLIPMFDEPILADIPSLRVTDRVNSVSQDLQFASRASRNGSLFDLGRRVEDELLRRRNSALDRAFIASGAVADNDVRTLVEETPLGYLLAETDPGDLSFQLDVSFLVQQGYDPGAVLSGLSDRVKSVHAKDVRTDEYTPGGWPSFVDAGLGHVDFERVVDAAQRNDIEWIIFENGHAEDPIQSIRGGIDVLRAAGLQG